MSSEPIATQLVPSGGGCRSCGAPLASDQRYCLECGERAGTAMSSLLASLRGAERRSAPPGSTAPAGPPAPAGRSATAIHSGGTATLLAGVGVLLLAMGVGVLIGRSGVGKTAAPAQVISVPAASGAQNATPGERAFTGDWPAGTDGYTVQLQALPQGGTTPAAVQTAKATASGKGAKAVGALKSSDYPSLKAGAYIVYSGVFRSKAKAERALRGMRKSFPAAMVIHVSHAGAAAAATGRAGASRTGSGVGESLKHPAPPSVLQNLNRSKGQSYEQRSRNLPNVISTG